MKTEKLIDLDNNQIKFVIFDFDGVFTDGKIFFLKMKL